MEKPTPIEILNKIAEVNGYVDFDYALYGSDDEVKGIITDAMKEYHFQMVKYLQHCQNAALQKNKP